MDALEQHAVEVPVFVKAVGACAAHEQEIDEVLGAVVVPRDHCRRPVVHVGRYLLSAS